MRVGQAMTSNPQTVRPGTTVRSALRILADHRVSMLPVVDEVDRLIGVVSEVDALDGELRPDLLPGAAAPGAAPGNLDRRAVVADVMACDPVRVYPEVDLAEVGRIVRTTGIRSLPVVDADGRVVGVVSASDVVRALARSDDQLQQEILDALAAAGISAWRVEVRNGVAELTHPASAPTDQGRACSITKSTPGVTDVIVYRQKLTGSGTFAATG